MNGCIRKPQRETDTLPRGNERYRAISFRDNFGLGDRSPQIEVIVLAETAFAIRKRALTSAVFVSETISLTMHEFRDGEMEKVYK
jgi:hypothetical protein